MNKLIPGLLNKLINGILKKQVLLQSSAQGQFPKLCLYKLLCISYCMYKQSLRIYKILINPSKPI